MNDNLFNFSNNPMSYQFRYTFSYLGQMGFISMLTLLFIWLKLAEIITWSWFWVFSPVIFYVSIWFIFLIILMVFAIRFAFKKF